MKYLVVILKAFNILNGVWTRVKGPIFGLLLLLSVCPLLSDNTSAKEDINQPKCLHACISSPGGVRGNLRVKGITVGTK